MQWHFVATEHDGEMWLQHPKRIPMFVDYMSSTAGTACRRIMVATKAWVLEQLADVTSSPSGKGHLLMSAILVLPDGSPEELRVALQRALEAPGLDHFSTIVTE